MLGIHARIQFHRIIADAFWGKKMYIEGCVSYNLVSLAILNHHVVRISHSILDTPPLGCLFWDVAILSWTYDFLITSLNNDMSYLLLVI